MSRNKNKILLIVESPAKCGTIVSHLGADKYMCVATFGHLRELTGLPDIDTTFAAVPQFHNVDTKQSQIEKIRALIGECKETYLMTDNDREGAGIAYHVCCLFGLPVATTKRIVFNEITKPALERAIQSPQLLNMHAVHAQIARQALDMLVGFKITPTLWSHVAGSSLSAGRCQTPALRLIYDNQRAIDAAAEGTIVYETVGYFTKMNLKYELSKGHAAAEACSAFLLASAEFQHVIRAPDVRPFSKPAPLPLTTCALQQQASNELNFSPADTMLACQHLYEGGYITYPRTDSRAYSVPFLEHAHAYIGERWGDKYVAATTDATNDATNAATNDKPKKRIVVKRKKAAAAVEDTKDTKDAKEEPDPEVLNDVKPQEAHEAVHVTSLHCVAVPDTMTPKEQRLYRMIWRHSAESCMAPCSGKTLTSCITAPEGREYRHSVERTEFAGWRIVAAAAAANDATHCWALLQSVAPDSGIKYNKLQSRMHIRELKSHYSEASLVSLLEDRGIGRPSTFSSLVHKIQERGYVAKQDVSGRRVSCINYDLDGGVLTQSSEDREFGNEKNRLVITPLGNMVIEFLYAHFADLFDYDYTKRMEQQLDHVSSGEKRWGDVCGDCLACVDRLLTTLNSKQLSKCVIPLGDGLHEFIMGKYGPLIRSINKDKDKDKDVLHPVRKDIEIDYAKLRRGEYTLADLVSSVSSGNNRNESIGAKSLCKLLGKYNGADLFLRTGKYGPYLTWGDQKQSLTHLKAQCANVMNVDEVPCSYDDAVRCIESSSSSASSASSSSSITTNPAILREINPHASVRTGQYGPYIYYKNPKMKTPAFVSLRGFKDNWKTCDLRLLDAWSTTTPVKPKKQ
jgi:DNA topoisomerase-1